MNSFNVGDILEERRNKEPVYFLILKNKCVEQSYSVMSLISGQTADIQYWYLHNHYKKVS